ncbi:hypothetical protein HK405_014340, partial [Cladochytrium tenue]
PRGSNDSRGPPRRRRRRSIDAQRPIPAHFLDARNPAADPLAVLRNALAADDPAAAAVALRECVRRDDAVNSAEPRLARLAPADAAAVIALVAKVASTRPDLDAARRAADAIADAARRAHARRELRGGAGTGAASDPAWELPYVDAVVRGLAAAGKPEYAAALLLQKAGDTATADAAFPRATHAAVIRGLAESARYGDAEAVLDAMHDGVAGLDHAEEEYAALAMGHAAAGRITFVMKAFSGKTDAQRAGVTPGAALHAAVVRAHAARLQPGDAVAAYRALRQAGLPGLPSVYVDLVRVHGRAGDVAAALKFYHKLDRLPGFRPAPDLVDALVEAFAINAELVSAWRALRDGFGGSEPAARAYLLAPLASAAADDSVPAAPQGLLRLARVHVAAAAHDAPDDVEFDSRLTAAVTAALDVAGFPASLRPAALAGLARAAAAAAVADAAAAASAAKDADASPGYLVDKVNVVTLPAPLAARAAARLSADARAAADSDAAVARAAADAAVLAARAAGDPAAA